MRIVCRAQSLADADAWEQIKPMATDTSEKGLESLIVAAITAPAPPVATEGEVARGPLALYGGLGWSPRNWKNFKPQ